MFVFFRMGRGAVRAAARSGGQRKPSQPRQKSGIPWFAVIVAACISAWVMEPLEHHGMSHGAAFLVVFPLWFVLTVVFAALGMAMKGGGGKTSTASQIRQAHARQEAARRAAASRSRR